MGRGTGITLGVFAAFLSYACGGCLSNEYVIPQSELARLAQLPPEQRGQHVRVVQELGDRRGEAIDTSQPPTPAYGQAPGYGPPPEGYVEAAPEPQVGVGIVIVPGVPGPVGPSGGYASGPGPRGSVGGFMGRTTPVAAPPARKPGGSGVGGGNLGGGGGGKNDAVALLIVVAVLATVGLVATEGARYDGFVAMYPWQPVYLQDQTGQEREVPLAQITPADVATSSKAVVKDDEGWGMMRLGRRALDRTGFAFKMDLGPLFSSCSCLSGDGFGTNVQFGYFPHHRFGLLGTWAFAGGSDSSGNSFYRNNLALEAQFFPIEFWRLHLGGFGHLGEQYADDNGVGTRSGLALGGGAIMEIGLTARLALTLRADYTSAKVAPVTGGWAGTEMFTMGVAIY